MVVGLYNFQLTPLQADLTDTSYLYLLIASLLFSIFCYLCFKLYNPKKTKNSKTHLSKKFFTYLFYLWCLVELIEIIWSRGVPVLWKISGSSKNYKDFGIPSVHGFANAYGLALITIMFYSCLKKRDKKILIRIIIMSIFYILILTRQVIISMILQMFIVYCFYKKRIPWMKIIIVGIVGTIVFGLLGNFRTGYSDFLRVSMIDSNISPFFIGVYWVYMYLTMSIANLNKTFSLIFSSVGTIRIFSVYLPSIIRKIIYSSADINLPDFLVTKAFTVSGYLMDFYLAYKIWGIVFISSMYGIMGGITYKKIRRNDSEKNIIYYAIAIQIILLSFFYNHLLYLPSGFQFVIIWLLYKRVKIKL